MMKPRNLKQLQAALTQRLETCLGRLSSSNPSETTAPTDSQSGQSKALACLDAETLQRLKAIQPSGQPDFYLRVLTRFLDTAPELMSALRRAVRDGDALALQQTAHSLKSSAGNVGALSLAEQCRELEAMGRVGDLRRAGAQLDEAEASFRAACDELGRAFANERCGFTPRPRCA